MDCGGEEGGRGAPGGFLVRGRGQDLPRPSFWLPAGRVGVIGGLGRWRSLDGDPDVVTITNISSAFVEPTQVDVMAMLIFPMLLCLAAISHGAMTLIQCFDNQKGAISHFLCTPTLESASYCNDLRVTLEGMWKCPTWQLQVAFHKRGKQKP